MIGIRRRRASATAMASRLVSTTKTAPGRSVMLRMPSRLRFSFASSARSFRASFFGSEAMVPSASMFSSCTIREIRLRMVTQLVSMPPSQRWLT